MSDRRFSSVQTKLYQLVFGMLLFLVGLSVTRGMLRGDKRTFRLVVAGLILATVLLKLNQYYWVVAAFLFGMSYGRSIPYLPFYGVELGSIVLSTMFFVRRALHSDDKYRANFTFVGAAFPFIVWVCIVWALHPAGLQVLGGSTMGGRYYFIVVLAYMALLFLSQLSLGERDSKWLAIAVCCGYLSFVGDILLKGGLGSLFSNSTHYQVLRLSFVAPVFLCRYSIPEILSRPKRFFPFMTLFGLAVWSGNRTAAARTAIVGVLAPFFLKRDLAKTWTVFVILAMLLGIVLMGQGHVWNLPFSVQRALSFMPVKWTDPRIAQAGFRDEFRRELRQRARGVIWENPWMGRGGFAIDAEELRWLFFANIARNNNWEGHELSGNWHNVWLGFAADFGIPLSIAWALFMGVFLVYGYRRFPDLVSGSWAQTAYLYFYLLGVAEFINSFFNGGHTATTPSLFFPWAGMMIAILNGSSVRRYPVAYGQS